MAGVGEGILIINPGSSSIKFSLYLADKDVFHGIIDGIGSNTDASATLELQYSNAPPISSKVTAADTFAACSIILDSMGKIPVRIRKVAYRVVHGGDYKDHKVIDKKVLSYLHSIAKLAPLHVPMSLEVIEFFMQYIKNAKHIALFDTVFHSRMPEYARTYAIPRKVSEKHSIKRYGFHGLAHELMWQKAKEIDSSASKVITCQLGNGVSLSAVKNGISIDTSMGFTPLEGLVMGTRSGNIDPALIEFLCKEENKSVSEITRMLEKESGLKGLCGEWDMRKVLAKTARGDASAKLAVEVFSYSFKKCIGAYIAVLNGADMIIIGGGIVKSPGIRKHLLSGMESLGIEIDGENINKSIANDSVCISKGRIKVYAVDSDEQEMMLKLAKRF